MSAVNSVNKLVPSDKSAFVNVMSRAFARDPLFLHAFGNSEADEKARRRAVAFVSFMFDKSQMLGEEVWGVFDNGSLAGAYIVETPHSGRLGFGRGLRLAGKLLPLMWRISGRSLNFLNNYMRVTRSAAPPWKHYYLIMIGVAPEAQGRGLGAALLGHLLNKADTDPFSRGVALDTENLHNLPMYRKFEFHLSQIEHIGDLPVYCMAYSKEQQLILLRHPARSES